MRTNVKYVPHLIILVCVLVGILIVRTRRYNERFQTRQSHTAVVFELNGAAGFFSVYFMLCTAYIYAKKNGYDFYLKMSGWHYTYKQGWHDYMTSLELWDPSYIYERVETYKHAGMGDIPKYTLKDYEEASREIFTVSPEIMEKVNAYKASLPPNYDSIYIRRGDKVVGNIKEMDLLSLQDILNKTDLTSNCSDLFVQTDDYTAIEELRQLLPNCKIHTLTNPDERGSSNLSLHNEDADKRYNDAVNLLVQMFVFAGGRNCWSDIRSNVGRMHKVMAYDKVHLYPRDDITRDYEGNLAYG
jgi:hypothetical protein